MGTVVDLGQARSERFSRRLEDELSAAIEGPGYLVVEVHGFDPEDWRRAAREAGHRLGYRMRTGASHDGRRVWAATHVPG